MTPSTQKQPNEVLTEPKRLRFGVRRLSAAFGVSAGVSFILATALPTHAEKITYEEHILPILRNSCLNCHNPDKKKAGLDLSTYQGALEGSENGKVLESGNPAASQLIKCIKQTDDPKMPPKGDKLSDSDIAVFEKWIAGQLLENSSGKAVAVAANKVSVAVVSLTKPDGPPPMPGDLPLEPYVRTAHDNAIVALAVSPWAPLAAVGGQKQVILYNTETLQPLGILPFPEGLPTIIHFSRNGQILLTGGGLGGKLGKVVLWDIKTGERIATIGNEFDQVLAADLSADQQYVALGGPNKLVKIYSTKDGKLVQSIKKHTDWVTAIAFSPDGKFLASADRAGGVVVWEAGTWKEFNTLAGHKAMVTGLAFMPGVVASSSEDGKVALWDAKEGKEIKSWTANAGGVEWVDFTPDGRLVTCGRDKIAKVWDQTGKALGQTKPLDDIALRAELSNDRIIVGDWTGKLVVTKLDGTPIGELTANPPSLADRIINTAKKLADAQAALPGLQQQLPAAEARLKAAQTAADDKHKAALAAAESHQKDVQKALDTIKAAPQEAEKHLAELKGQLPALQQAVEAAKKAVEASQKNVTDKQTAASTGAGGPELETAKQEAAAKVATHTDAEKQLAARKNDVTQAEAALTKIRSSQPANLTAAEKNLKQAATQLAEAQKPAPAAPEVTSAEQELAKIKTALDTATSTITSSKADAERWKVAKVLQNAHDAKDALINKQAQYDQLVQEIKDAPQAIEKAKSDLADAKKTIADGPAKLQENEKALAKSHAALEKARTALTAAEDATKEKEKAAQAAMDAAPTMGDVVNLTKKMETLNTDAAKLREERNTHSQGTPEYLALNEKYQAKKAQIVSTQTALTAASAKNMEAPAIKAALAEIDKARATADETRRALKTVTKAAATADKGADQIKKAVEAATQLAAKLEKDMPQIVKDAETEKTKAEQAAAVTSKEVEAAKAEADKRRADYETLKSSNAKAAALQHPADEVVTIK
jgi:hypothetical protein